MPSTASAPADTTPGSCRGDVARPRTVRACAIHQPNLLPRLSTLAKLYSSDVWVVLDDVQFARRDYQHRARLAALDDPRHHQWLSLETRLPIGRATHVCDAQLVDPLRAARRLVQLPAQHYHASPYWRDLHLALMSSVPVARDASSTAAVAEASTRALLNLLDWHGTILRSSGLPASSGRSTRLADLAAAVDADTYLCGTGGMRYLDDRAFTERHITVHAFRPPSTTGHLWSEATKISALWALARYGPSAVRAALDDTRATVRLA